MLGLALSAVPATADSRDLVLERISRCYALADTRQYLECLYGAVQPLRGELGLPNAPQATSFAPLFTQPVPQNGYSPKILPASAAPPPARIPQPVERDRGSAIANIFDGAMGIKTVKVPAEQFGLRNARPGPGVNVDHITARMSQYSLDKATGYFTVTLDNGQVWQQQKGDEHSPVWMRAASSYVATVSYGAGNSYNLVITGERQPYKVQRIR